MSARKASTRERVGRRMSRYAAGQVELAELRHDLAEAMVEAKAAGNTQQEIADATDVIDADPLSRQRVKQLIDDFNSGRI